MTLPDDERREEREIEIDRVKEETAFRLRARGVDVHDTDAAEDLAALLESVEDFEIAVEAQGGDLMVAEPPEGHVAEPQDARFALPARTSSESAESYLARLAAATAVLRDQPPL
jgi:hypothetical protein